MPQPFRVILPVTDIEHAAAFYAAVLFWRGSACPPAGTTSTCEGTILARYDPRADGDGYVAMLKPEPIYVAVTARLMTALPARASPRARRRTSARSVRSPRARGARSRSTRPPRSATRSASCRGGRCSGVREPSRLRLGIRAICWLRGIVTSEFGVLLDRDIGHRRPIYADTASDSNLSNVSGYFRTSQSKAAACSFGLLRPCSQRSSVRGFTPILNAKT